jgi:hypothetical protein
MSLQNNKYALLIVDDYTSYTWVKFLSSKDQAGDALMSFIVQHATCGKFVQTLRTDNGGEFTSAVFGKFLWERGIQHNRSPPYTPQFQGKVERMNRTVGEKAHSMRVGAGLPESYWELAWGCAVFLRNRSPTSANPGKMTPYESMYGRKPVLENLRVFGCRAEALVPDAVRGKDGDRSRPGIFVGYDEVSKGYKFLPDGSRKWVPVRTVAFDEVINGNTVDVMHMDENMEMESAVGNGDAVEMSEDEEEDKEEYEAQRKGEERPQLVAAKSLPMITRSQLKRGLQEAYRGEEDVAMVGIDAFGAESYGVKGVDVYVPRSLKEALGGMEGSEWRDAISEEIKAMEDAEVWGQPVVEEDWMSVTPLRFIFTKKMGANGEIERYKARLVFQNRDSGDENEDVYAPVVDKVSLRVFLTVVAKYGWCLEQSDVKTAFLHAENVGNEYVKLPGGVGQDGKGMVRKLQKALYGLRRAPKAWNSTFTEWAVQAGFKQLGSEACLFVHGELSAMIVVYVDDLLVAAASSENVKKVQNLIGGRFQVRHLGRPKFFLGMNVNYNREQRKVHLCQHTYVDALMERYQGYVGAPRSLPIVCGVVLNKEQGELQPTDNPYSSLVGALLFLSVCTRPDISFAVGSLAKFISNPGEQHWRVAVDVLAYVGATRGQGIMLGDVRGKVIDELVAYADSDWANDTDDRKSVSGGVLYLGGSLVAWHSKKQHMVCTSTAEAEIHAILGMAETVKMTRELLSELIQEFGFCCSGKIPVLLSDNQPGLDAVSSRRARTKHYDIKVKFIAQCIDDGDFLLQYVPSSANIADVLTKPLRAVRFKALVQLLMSEAPVTSANFQV